VVGFPCNTLTNILNFFTRPAIAGRLNDDASLTKPKREGDDQGNQEERGTQEKEQEQRETR
jgi:hypothetical protein